MSTNFADEFRLYEGMFSINKETRTKKLLKEAYSIEEIANILTANGLSEVSARDLALALKMAKSSSTASTDAIKNTTITVDEVKKLKMPKGTYALMSDADNDYSFFTFEDGRWYGGSDTFGGAGVDDLNTDSRFLSFSDAVTAAVSCHAAYRGEFVYIVLIDYSNNVKPVACIDSMYSGGKRKFSTYDQTKGWSAAIELL